MQEASMTAKGSAFSRGYHATDAEGKVFDDPLTHTHLVAVDFADEERPQALIDEVGFERAEKSLCSLSGLVYYLSKDVFANLRVRLSSLFAPGSRLVFDYPVASIRTWS